MQRSFCSSCSTLVKFWGLFGSGLSSARVVYLHATTVDLRSAENEGGDGHEISYKGKIPLDSFTIKYARSSGPGGQNVNKVNTKVDLRFHVQSAHWISEDVREKILNREKNRINSNGELVIMSTRYRSQHKNLQDAIQKVEAIVEDASYVPKETTVEKKAHVRKLVRISNEKRLQAKKFLSDKKKDRR